MLIALFNWFDFKSRLYIQSFLVTTVNNESEREEKRRKWIRTRKISNLVLSKKYYFKSGLVTRQSIFFFKWGSPNVLQIIVFYFRTFLKIILDIKVKRIFGLNRNILLGLTRLQSTLEYCRRMQYCSLLSPRNSYLTKF